MKKLIEVTAAIKTFAALVFAGAIIVYTVFGGWFFDVNAIPLSLVWQLLFISLLASILQFIFFSDNVFPRMRYVHRFVFFAVPLFALVGTFAYAFRWFPVHSAVNWGIFFLVYLFFFGIITVVFELYAKITGKRFTAMLDAYNARHS